VLSASFSLIELLVRYIHCVSKNNNPFVFVYNFGKCRLIFKIISLADSLRNLVHIYHKDSPSHFKYVSTLPCKTWKFQLLPISRAYCIWNLKNSYCKVWGRLISSGLNPV